ncbi:methyltransferase [Streptomyces sp. NPDC001220]
MPTDTPKGPDDRLGVNSWEVREEQEVPFLGRTWKLLPSVYPMQRVRSSEFFWEQLAAMGPVNRFLDMGCGSGAFSVLALQTKVCRAATAVDINPAAVENTQINARRHGVQDGLTALRGDLYDPLEKDDRFDLIFWNSPGVYIEEDASLSAHERSIFDPGYATHIRYIAEGSNRLTDSGRLTLGFCGKGNLPLLEGKASAAGFASVIVAKDNQGNHPHWLLEFKAQEHRPG